MEENQEISQLLLDFLDADYFTDKFEILQAASARDFDDLLIDNMAASIDTVIAEGPIDARLSDLKNCVRTRAKYESLRLRK